MSELEEVQPTTEDMLKMILVTQMRIYDVLLTDLRLKNQEITDKLVQAHEKFDNIGPLPFMEEQDV